MNRVWGPTHGRDAHATMRLRDAVLILVTGIIALVPVLPVSAGAAAEPWWDARWAFCLPLKVDAGAWDRTEAPAEVFANFTGLLAQAGHGGTVIPDSLRLFEAGSEGTLTPVHWQPWSIPIKPDVTRHWSGIGRSTKAPARSPTTPQSSPITRCCSVRPGCPKAGWPGRWRSTARAIM
ncbi:MAG: hypothetical protein FJ280_06890 [Planctomycetes bacterium]|nr:hypothetical protein [Planctomycetota bacterium]